jgi:hypothetical protein
MALTLRRSFLVLGLLGLLAAAAHADIIYLKDGTVLYGRVIQETTMLTDPATGSALPVPKGNNVYAVYDGTRVVSFSPLQLDPNRPVEKTDHYANLVKLERIPPAKPWRNLSESGRIEGKLEFDAKGKRTIRIRNERGFVKVEQMLTGLTPYQLRILSTEVVFTQNFLTAELDPSLVLSLAANFPQIKDEKDPVEKRFKLNLFMTQAKWYDRAEKDLDDIEKTLPQAKERVAKARQDLTELEAEDWLEVAGRALQSGQLRACQACLARIPRQGLNANLNVRINSLRVKAEDISRRFDLAQHFLTRLPDDTRGECAEVLCSAASVIREELHIEALDRLQPFIDLAEQAEKAQKAGRDPVDKPEQLLARAISGWLLGKESSDARPEVASRLWRARQMVATYIRTPLVQDRNDLLRRYEKREPVEIEELAKIIALLPPAQLVQAPTEPLPEPQARKTDLPSANQGPIDYVIQLPPEYRPGRPYPLIVALHDDGESPKRTIERYSYEARRNGYILVAPEWGSGFGGKWTYEPEERQRVLDVIRDVRMRYHIDSDRIFLSGVGEGASGAWDVGLSHPDIFAAVVPMAGDPQWQLILRYWPNAMHLPFYVINGEYGSDLKGMLRTMEYWINAGFPCLSVIYQGRGREWYHAELPNAFEWMNRHKRYHPFPEIGRWPTPDKPGLALATMRPSNNHFYWLTVDDIRTAYQQQGDKTPENAARLQAAIKANNFIDVRTFGLKQFTVWLGPNMIDFKKPVTVKLGGMVNMQVPLKSFKLKPDLSLMMEDFLERGDNTRLFVSKIALTPTGLAK